MFQGWILTYVSALRETVWPSSACIDNSRDGGFPNELWEDVFLPSKYVWNALLPCQGKALHYHVTCLVHVRSDLNHCYQSRRPHG